jgi:DNA-binding response OmpR family regulator
MKTVMIIDDSALVLKLSQIALERAGYKVTALVDFGEFEPSVFGIPDLVLVDVHMPMFYGDDVVNYLKETWNLSAPVYLFSSAPEPELERACDRCGANGYISKEWGVEALIEQVRTVLG